MGREQGQVTCKLTDMTENITVPQLRWLAVKILNTIFGKLMSKLFIQNNLCSKSEAKTAIQALCLQLQIFFIHRCCTLLSEKALRSL